MINGNKTKGRLVVAIGGNAILKPNQRGTVEKQLENIRGTCQQIGEMIIQNGYKMLLTYGNGPQVGNILLQNELAKELVSPMPLDICGAESQGLLGYLMARELRNALAKAGLRKTSVVSMVTQTLISSSDPAFQNPTKPIGPSYNKAEAEKLKRERGYQVIKDADRGWRRVVPSPDPIAIVESPVIKKLIDQDVIVIACGGGGVPVTEEGGELIGQEAVVDKDLAACKLAGDIRAKTLLVLTDVKKVMLDYGTRKERGIDRMTISEAHKYMDEGHFAEGSMKSKIKACIQFIEGGGERAIVTSLQGATDGLSGASGTIIS